MKKMLCSFLLFICLSLAVNAHGVLQKEEASRQLVNDVYETFGLMYYLNKFVDPKQIPDHFVALKKAGFIDLAKAGNGGLKIVLLSKARPYFVKEENDELFFKLSGVQYEAISISQPRAYNDGEAVCIVHYRQQITHNELLKIWHPHCFKEGAFEGEARFVKIAGHWKLVESFL